MALIRNELGELYRSEDFEEPRHLKLRYMGEPADWPKPYTNARCAVCGEPFYSKRSGHRYCSQYCQSKAKNARARARKKADGGR